MQSNLNPMFFNKSKRPILAYCSFGVEGRKVEKVKRGKER